MNGDAMVTLLGRLGVVDYYGYRVVSCQFSACMCFMCLLCLLRSVFSPPILPSWGYNYQAWVAFFYILNIAHVCVYSVALALAV